MKLMIINPDWGMTREQMDRELRELSAFVSETTELFMECLTHTEVCLDSAADIVLAGPEILSMARKAERDGFDAVILYCFSDPALEACRQCLTIPVIGAGQAACLMIPQVGYHGTVLLADDRRIPEKMASVCRTGLQTGRILNFRGIALEGLSCVSDRESVIEKLCRAGKQALLEQPSQVIVLGCLSFLGMAQELEKKLGVPVIDPAALSVSMAELMVRQGLHSSKRAYPDRKHEMEK